jgi:hypothetical protein
MSEALISVDIHPGGSARVLDELRGARASIA